MVLSSFRVSGTRTEGRLDLFGFLGSLGIRVPGFSVGVKEGGGGRGGELWGV